MAEPSSLEPHIPQEQKIAIFLSQIAHFIKEDEPGEALELLTQEIPKSHDLYDEALLLQTQYIKNISHRTKRTRSDQELDLEYHQILDNILNLTRRWERQQEGVQAEHKVRRGVTEHQFKVIIFVGIITIKGMLLIWLYFINGTGSFLPYQFQTLMGIMWPLFTASAVFMAKHFYDIRYKQIEKDSPVVNRLTQWIAYIALSIYLFSYLLAFREFSTSAMEFTGLLSWLNKTESLLGGIIAYVISTFFKKSKKSES